jgi:hypothetical protein
LNECLEEERQRGKEAIEKAVEVQHGRLIGIQLPKKIQGELRRFERTNLPTKGLRSKRRSTSCIFQVATGKKILRFRLWN